MFSLGEMRSDRAVIPLMKVLHEGQTDQERIVAALALCLIGDGRGEYAVKRAARFDDSDRVRQTAAWFYNEYVRDGTFKFVPVQDADSYRMAQLMAQVREQR
jgi:hypothetical protein